jgi:hypothetical protein
VVAASSAQIVLFVSAAQPAAVAMQRAKWAALGLALLLVSVPLIRADEEAEEDDKDVVVITKDNWKDKIEGSKFALVR